MAAMNNRKCECCGKELSPLRRDSLGELQRAYRHLRIVIVGDGKFELTAIDINADPRMYNILEAFVEYRID